MIETHGSPLRSLLECTFLQLIYDPLPAASDSAPASSRPYLLYAAPLAVAWPLEADPSRRPGSAPTKARHLSVLLRDRSAALLLYAKTINVIPYSYILLLERSACLAVGCCSSAIAGRRHASRTKQCDFAYVVI